MKANLIRLEDGALVQQFLFARWLCPIELRWRIPSHSTEPCWNEVFLLTSTPSPRRSLKNRVLKKHFYWSPQLNVVLFQAPVHLIATKRASCLSIFNTQQYTKLDYRIDLVAATILHWAGEAQKWKDKQIHKYSALFIHHKWSSSIRISWTYCSTPGLTSLHLRLKVLLLCLLMWQSRIPQLERTHESMGMDLSPNSPHGTSQTHLQNTHDQLNNPRQLVLTSSHCSILNTQNNTQLPEHHVFVAPVTMYLPISVDRFSLVHHVPCWPQYMPHEDHLDLVLGDWGTTHNSGKP